MAIRAVTLDAYGTLFNLDAVMLPAVREIVAGQSLDASPESISRSWSARFHKAHGDCALRGASAFLSIREITSRTLSDTFAELGVSGDIGGGVETWFRHVASAPLYPEVREAVEALASRFRLALISDTDDDYFLPAWLDHALPVEHVFTSEAMRSYKLCADGVIFEKAFAALGVKPHEVAHVGDSSADVLGAARVGATPVWLNRDGRPWRDSIEEPEHIARDMLEAAERISSA